MRYTHGMLWAWLVGGLLLGSTTASWADVGAPFNTAYGSVNSGAADKEITLTIASGHSNTALVVWVGWATQAVTVSSVTWDPAGANQALTAVAAAVTAGTTYSKQAFRLVNPTAGTSKVVRVTMSSGTVSNVNIGAAAYDGVDQSAPTANFTSNTTGAALTVTASSGDATTTSIITSNSVTSSDQTDIWGDSTPSASADGGDYALAAGNVTHTWTAAGVVQLVAGFTLVKAVASSVVPVRTLLGVGL